MLKIFIISVILLKILIPLQALKTCDFSECNHEGQCTRNDRNEKLCTCIGSKYFKGPKCSEAIDLCQMENPCQNEGKCRAVVGQFICEDCNPGFSGLWCDLEVSNIFEKMLLYFNHYGYYGETHKFLIMVETLGEKTFSLELVGDNYAIESFETKPQQTNKWLYSEHLPGLIRKLGIRYYQDLPYAKGYYHVASETFWDLGLLSLTLRSYDTETAAQFFYQHQFDLLIAQRRPACVPQLQFIHGANTLEPLMLDIASYNNFEIVLKKRCFKASHITYHWSVYNSIGSVKLHDFGLTNGLILKIRPFKLWFNYHGEVASSYSIVVRMVEHYGSDRRETQTRCFILVLPKPVTALIKGGSYREVGVKQDFTLDGSNSRDFVLAADALQDMFYSWDCVSEEDPFNTYCRKSICSSSILKIKSGNLELHKTYNFTLTINSKVNKLVSDHAYQLVKIRENSQLSIDIKCLRNCARNEFVQQDKLHLKAVSLSAPFSKAAKYTWTLREQVIGNSEHLIYETIEMDKLLEIQVLVKDRALSGMAVQNFKVNLPPQNGSCFIAPITGEAFNTNFHIRCEHYFDTDTPLNYEYFLESGFPLQRTNEAEIYTKLPACKAVIIKICDQFQACIANKLTVVVEELEVVQDLKRFLTEKEGGLKNLLLKGDVLTAMVLLKSLMKSLKNIADVTVIQEQIKNYEIKTLLQVEQFLEIGRNLVGNNLPLTADKALVFSRYFLKLQQGFKRVLKDDEIKTFKRLPYEKTCQELLQIMQNFSYKWENIPPVQLVATQAISSKDPLKETYPDLPDFDVNITEHLKSWLDISQNLQDCFNCLAEGAKELYAPWEDVFILQKNYLHLQIFAFDNDSEQEMQINDDHVKVVLNEACVRNLQENFKDKEILLQVASLNSNPFWWYPSARPLNSEVFLFSAFSRQSNRILKYLKTPFEFKIKLNSQQANYNAVLGVIKNALHMPLYTLELPANAVLVVTFLKVEKPLKFLIQIGQPPASYKVLQTGHELMPLKEHAIFIVINPFNHKSSAYLAVLMETPLENITFSFHSEIRECLFWDFSLQQPQWSSQGCRPKMEIQNNDSLSCFCHHFSTFTASTYEATVQEDLKQHLLLKELSINCYVVRCYLSLIVLSVCIILHNLYRYKNHKGYLPINSPGLFKQDIEVHIFTGSHWNASTSANISLRFISHRGPFSLDIHQDPDNPFLLRNSRCKLQLSSQDIQLPVKLNISNDLNGRYPSWYCHKILVNNLKTLEQQLFLIDQWVGQRTLEVTSSYNTPLTFKERFREILCKIYINWYQFQPVWGCWQYDDLNRLERCCIWLCQLWFSVSSVAVYFGVTNMETYEEERSRYYYLDFNILELLLLSSVCYILNIVVNVIFRGDIWLLCKMHVWPRKKSKKFV